MDNALLKVVEKSVKAVFQNLHGEARGHSVADLLKELSKRYEVSKEIVDRGLELDKAYIPTRYLDAHSFLIIPGCAFFSDYRGVDIPEMRQ